MKSYQRIEDFLLDRSFKDWVLKGGGSQAEFWEKWQLKHPDKVAMLLQARIILLELESPDAQWGETRKGQLYAKIISKIGSEAQLGEKGSPTPYKRYKRFHSPIEKWVRI